MSESERLSLKVLDERLRRVEDEYAFPPRIIQNQYDGPGPDYFEDILVAVINALFGLRSAGAYHLAKGLEEKYFDGKDVKRVGDRITAAQDLYSSSAEKSKKE